MKNSRRLKNIYEQYKLNQMRDDYNDRLIYFMLFLRDCQTQRTILKFYSFRVKIF